MKKRVDKVSALKAIMAGPASLGEFAERLVEDGFRIKGPRKAYNVMVRLYRQGLVRKVIGSGDVHYTLKTKDGATPVVRRQLLVTWELTQRGQKRFDYLTSPEPESGTAR